MKKLRVIFLILVLLPWSPSLLNQPVVHGKGENVGYLLKSMVKYRNPTQNRVWNFIETEDDRTISLFMNNTWQTVELLNSTLPIEKTEKDDDGNPVAILRFPKPVLNPGESLNFTVWYHIISKPRAIPQITESESHNLSDIPSTLVLEYTREEGPWQTSNRTLKELASSLKGRETKALTIISSFVTWIKASITYPIVYHENPYYPNETYANREGDCDDQAILLITLCRIVGIPSYLQVGCIYLTEYFDNSSFWNGHTSMIRRRVSWHGWAVVYIPPWGWLPVDLTYVAEGFADPLNAIRYGAVVGQNTAQYMNFSKVDYVADSRQAKTFLLENGFFVDLEDEMIVDVLQNGPIRGFNPWLPAIGLAVVVVTLLTGYFLIVRRWRRYPEEPKVPTPPSS